MKFRTQVKQLSLDVFRSSLESLDKTNRWVILGDTLPWDDIARLYNARLHNANRGAGNKPARMIIGALLIKHKMSLSDEETIQVIRENPYMQYFVGLSEFTDQPIFEPSLFVLIRKRLGADDFNQMSVSVLTKQLEEAQKHMDSKKPMDENSTESMDEDLFTDGHGRLHKGTLKVDATCSDAEVRYPTDIDLLHDGCKVINRYTDKLSKLSGLPRPKSHYKLARQAYLEVIKRKKKSRKLIHQGKLLLLNYLHRDIRAFIDLIATGGTNLLDGLRRDEKCTLGAILKMYYQQEEMFRTNSKTCANRIISIFQPHIRPIVRGKSKTPTEFGAKIGASIVQGYTFIDHHSWDAYNESTDLKRQIMLYEERFGFLPAKINADKIYMNKDNRALMKDLEIIPVGKPLGRPPKVAQTEEYQTQMKQAAGERNEIEATFGTGKRIYRANNIRAKLPDTADCWTAMCYFVKNVMKFLRELLRALIFLLKLLLNRDVFFNIEKKSTDFALCFVLMR